MANVFKKLGEGIADVSELHVQTFTGSLTAVVDTDQGSLIAWDTVLDAARNQGEVTLVAATKVNFDGDTILFVATDASPTMLAVHQEAVLAAQEVRQGLVEAFRGVLGLD